jgi:hypothetical protein
VALRAVQAYVTLCHFAEIETNLTGYDPGIARSPAGEGQIQMATYREELEELRDTLKERLDVAGARDTASIAKVYADVLGKIAALDSTRPQEGSKLDELAAARERRRANATDH